MQRRILVASCCVCFLGAADWCSAQSDTIARPMSGKERKKQDRKVRRELQSAYRDWLDIDVAYIITDAERKAFTQLSNDEEREQFIEQFWLGRDPTPDTDENEFKEEHYRRIAYANERFASGIPGWKADRGMVYIKYGPPDEIESHPSGGAYQRSIEEGGGQISTYPFEQWRYRHLEGIGENVVIEFVDQTMSGEYRITLDPNEKNALHHLAGSQQQPRGSEPTTPLGRNQFDAIERLAGILRPPTVKFRDLEATVTSSVRYNSLPLKVRTDFIPLTADSILTSITLGFNRQDLRFELNGASAKALVNVYARVSTISRRTVNVFEDAIAVETVSGVMGGSALYQKNVPLSPGRYRLNIAAKDVVSGGMATYETALDVPPFEDGKLAASSLILADLMESVRVRSVGSGQFVIGGAKVRPRVDATFRRDERLGIYVQLYHFALDPITGKPHGSIEYEIDGDRSGAAVFESMEDVDAQTAASWVIVEKWLPLAGFEPGAYTLKLNVTDKSRGVSITPSATFTVD
jgi:GWxTD domain-containing protein